MGRDIEYKPKDIITALAASPVDLDPREQDFVSKVREFGWHCTNVFGDEQGPGFSYSTGIWLSTGFPEIVVFSLKSETAQAVIWDIFRDIQSGKPPPIGARTSSIFANIDAVLLPCAKSRYRNFLGWSRWFYGGDDFDCVQLVWPDATGRFPWEPKFDQQRQDNQPDMTEKGWTAALAN
jgi:hypothetical protein